MALKPSLFALAVVLLCFAHTAKPVHASWMRPSQSEYTVREEMEVEGTTPPGPDPTDGLIGICPAGLALPISQCFCYALFVDIFAVASDPEGTVAGCLSFVGSEEVILASGAYCIPFNTIDGTLNVELLIGALNQLLVTTCMDTDNPLLPVVLA